MAVCLLLVLIVLMQLPRSEGLGAAFGGGVTENIFGAQTTNVLARFTVWLGIAFFVITLLLAVAYSRMNSGRVSAESQLMNQAIPSAAAPAATAPSATPVPAATPAVVSPPAASEATPSSLADPALPAALPGSSPSSDGMNLEKPAGMTLEDPAASPTPALVVP